MILSKSSLIASVVTAVVLMVSSPTRAFIVGAFIAPMPFYFVGLIIDRYPSISAVIASLIVIALDYYGVGFGYSIPSAIVVGTAFNIWRRTRVGHGNQFKSGGDIGGVK